jgi:hypothetical protein
MKRHLFAGVSVTAALAAAWASPAFAAEADAPAPQVSEVVVTGSYIAGTPQNAPCRCRS